MNKFDVLPAVDGDELNSTESRSCWNNIGVHGDRSCPEIPKHIHCRNCPIYIEAGTQLFNREPPSTWLAEHKVRLSEIDPPIETDTITVLIFCLGDECLALDIRSMVEVAEVRTIHRVPHRTGGHLEGIVNIRGEIQLCVSLAKILSLIERSPASDTPPDSRLIVAEHGRQKWVFAVDKVLGVHRLGLQKRTELPATLRRSSTRLSRHVYDWNGMYVCHLDSDRLFAAMQKGLQ